MTKIPSYNWEPAPHTADLAISISAAEPSGLFYAALDGLMSLNEFSQETKDDSKITDYVLNICVACIEEALVDFLNECIYLMEVEELIPFRLQSIEISDDEYNLVLKCRQATKAELKTIGHIKAATYSALEVKKVDDRFEAGIIFDT